jgi:hypothetical protein
LHDVKSHGHQLIIAATLSAQHRNQSSTNALRALSRQTHHPLHEYSLAEYDTQQKHHHHHHHQQHYQDATSFDVLNRLSRPCMINANLHSGFRPSTIRHSNRQRLPTDVSRTRQFHDVQQCRTKQVFIPSHAAVRLRSEIDHIHCQLKQVDDANKRDHNRASYVRDIDRWHRS